MRHIIIICSFLVFTFNSNSQSYVPMPMQNCAWNQTFHAACTWMSGSGDFYKNYSLYPLNDTIITTKRYIKFYANVTTTTTGAGCSNSNVITQGYWGALRQDTLNQKIYLVPKNQSSERLFYNFNLSKGDSLKTIEGQYPGFGWYRYVDTIYYQSYSDGICRRVYRLYPPANYINLGTTYTYYDKMIEGIGFITGLEETKKSVSGSNYTESFTAGLTINSQPITIVTTNTCAQGVGINEPGLNIAQIRVYPNPFNTKITIVSAVKTKIQIYNVLGAIVSSSVTENEKTEFDLSNQANGIYFIKAGAVTKKIIKQ